MCAGIVRRTLIRTLFRRMFGAPIDNATLAAFVEYATWGATCVLGDAFHRATAGVALRKVAAIRATLQARHGRGRGRGGSGWGGAGWEAWGGSGALGGLERLGHGRVWAVITAHSLSVEYFTQRMIQA